MFRPVRGRSGACLRGAIAGAALVLVASLHGSSAAQAPPAAPDAGTPAAAASQAPRAEDIRAQIAAVETDAALSPAVKEQVRETYRQALAFDKTASDWAARAASLDKDARTAPERTAELRLKAAEPLPDPLSDVAEGAADAEVEKRLAEARLALEAARKEAAAVEEALKNRPALRQQLPQRIAAARQEIETISRDLSAPAPEGEAAVLTEAKRVLLLKRREALEQAVAAYEKELASYEVVGPLLALQRDLAQRNGTAAERRVKALEGLLDERRRRQAELAAEKALEELRAAADAHPVIRRLAEENKALAEAGTGPKGPATRTIEVNREQEQVNARLTKLLDDVHRMEARVEQAGGLGAAVGLYLRTLRGSIPDVRTYRAVLRTRPEEIVHLQLKRIELREKRGELADLDAAVAATLRKIEGTTDESVLRQIESDVRKKLEWRRDFLDEQVLTIDRCLAALFDLVAAERQLVRASEAATAYIDERVLWVRSASPVSPSDARRALPAVAWLLSRSAWARTALLLGGDLVSNWPLWAFGLVVIGGLLWLGRRGRARVGAVADLVASAETDRFHHTLAVLLVALLSAAPLPAALRFLAWRLGSLPSVPPVAEAAAYALTRIVVLLAALELVRHACAEKGLAAAHFRWRAEAVHLLRGTVLRLEAVVLPLLAVHAMLEWQPSEAWLEALGRPILIVALAATAWLLYGVSRPSGAFMKDLSARNPGGWAERLPYVLCAIAVALPLALAIGAALGYGYTARQLEKRLDRSAVLLIGLALLHALLRRLTFVQRRRLALRKAHERHAERPAESGTDLLSKSVRLRPMELNLYTINLQTRRLLATFTAAALLAGLWLIWRDVFPALGALDRVVLYRVSAAPGAVQAARGPEATLPSGPTDLTSRMVSAPAARPVAGETSVPITLADLLVALVILVLTVAAARNIPGLLEIALLRRLPLDQGARFAITTLSRYVLILVGAVLCFRAIGIGWSKVQWLAAAITFGLAFGLQEIVANFVSGLIILFERPMRPGDVVTVGEVTGIVTRIRIRATTITDMNRKELIVPNKEFITSRLVNWTLSDPVLRVIIPVGIAYGSDTAFARRVLLKVAEQNPLVLKDPPPQALFLGFGDSSLQFELRAFITGYDHYWRAIHELHMAVDDAFRKAKIEIAFPQRDIHVRSIRTDIPIVQKDAKEEARDG